MMTRSCTVRHSVLLAVAAVAVAGPAAAQGISVEGSVGYDRLLNGLALGEFETPHSIEHQSSGFGVDGRLAFLSGDRLELGASFSLQRSTLALREGGRTCLESSCLAVHGPIVESHDYTQLVSAVLGGRFWPNGMPDERHALRPLVGLHTGVLWHNDSQDVNWGVPIGVDGGIGIALTDRVYSLTYLTGQMLLVNRQAFGDGFGFRWGVRTGFGIRL